MIISPPFLPSRGARQSEEEWLNGAMAAPPSRLRDTGAAEGSFPLSHNLSWHNGMHIQAPIVDGISAPARAIADGRVIFASPPAAANTNVDDAQNYNPFDRSGAKSAAWTDNGCVIIEHRTSIGAEGAAETEVVFYSLYMHLSAIGKVTPPGETRARPLAAGDAIWRKDEVGSPGQIYGHAGQIHFEVCFDEANLQRLIGRAPTWVEPAVPPAKLPAPTADGRIDSIFGSLYFYLPASTATDTGAKRPESNLRGASVATETTLGTPIWVKMNYVAGDCTFESFDECGAAIGASRTDADAEYGLSREASDRHNVLLDAEAAGSSPSGWYELLRFGRNIGRGAAATDKDPLPGNAAHWRRIVGPSSATVWVDLNAKGSFKFSDADFLPVVGWNFLYDDTSPNDQRCDSENLKNLIRDPDTANSALTETTGLAERLGDHAVQLKLSRTICKFPTEWDKATVSTRYAFVQKLEPFTQAQDAWPRLEAHLNAVTFDELPAAYLAADWHLQPVALIGLLRKCGWLDKDNLARIYRNTDDQTRERYRVALNQITRKYLYASNPLRLSHFLGQGAIESTSLRSMQEASMVGRQTGVDFFGTAINPASRVPEAQLGHWYGALPIEDDAWFRSTKFNSRGGRIASSYNWRNGNLGDPDAQKFRGRGFKQLTGLLNYSRYWVFRGWLDRASFDDRWWDDAQYGQHNAARMSLRSPTVDDPERAGQTAYNCIDTGGWYLGSERPATLREIDGDSRKLAASEAERASEQAISYAVTQAINGGGIQRDDRLRETRAAKVVLL